MWKKYKNESKYKVIKKIVNIVKTSKKDPKISKQAIQQIEQARARMKKWHFLTQEEANKRLRL